MESHLMYHFMSGFFQSVMIVKVMSRGERADYFHQCSVPHGHLACGSFPFKPF